MISNCDSEIPVLTEPELPHQTSTQSDSSTSIFKQPQTSSSTNVNLLKSDETLDCDKDDDIENPINNASSYRTCDKKEPTADTSKQIDKDNLGNIRFIFNPDIPFQLIYIFSSRVL